jgi:hypothetical protein
MIGQVDDQERKCVVRLNHYKRGSNVEINPNELLVQGCLYTVGSRA